MRRATITFGLLCAGALLLAACTTPMFTMPPGPAPYRVGFHDGCDSGYAYAQPLGGEDELRRSVLDALPGSPA